MRQNKGFIPLIFLVIAGIVAMGAGAVYVYEENTPKASVEDGNMEMVTESSDTSSSTSGAVMGSAEIASNTPVAEEPKKSESLFSKVFGGTNPEPQTVVTPTPPPTQPVAPSLSANSVVTTQGGSASSSVTVAPPPPSPTSTSSPTPAPNPTPTPTPSPSPTPTPSPVPQPAPTPVPPPSPSSTQSGTMTLSKYAAYQNQTISTPAGGFRVGEYRVQTNSIESITLSSIKVALAGDYAHLNNVQVIYDGISSSVIPVAGATQTFILNKLIPPNTTISIRINADLGGGLAGDITSTVSVEGDGSTSGAHITTTQVSGQTISAQAGQVETSVHFQTPPSKLLSSGVQKVSSFKFKAVGDSFTLKELTARLDSSLPAGSPSAVTQIIWKDGATTIATQPLLGRSAVSTGLAVSISAGSDKVLDAYLDIGSLGGGEYASLTLDGFSADALKGGTFVDTTDKTGNSFVIAKTKPTLSSVALPSTTLDVGVKALARIAVAADASGMLEWKKVTFTITKTSDTEIDSSAFAFVEDIAPATPIPSAITTSGSFGIGGTGGTVTIVLASPQEVSGTKTYSLRAPIASTGSSQNVATSLSQGASAPSSGSFATISSGSSNFVWSDVSATPHDLNTPDWMTDYLVPNSFLSAQTLSN